MKKAWTMLVFCALLVAFLIADFFHKVNRTPWPYLMAKMGDKQGVVVSHYPLDIRVTINTNKPGTDEREWITNWRWNCEFYNADNWPH